MMNECVRKIKGRDRWCLSLNIAIPTISTLGLGYGAFSDSQHTGLSQLGPRRPISSRAFLHVSQDRYSHLATAGPAKCLMRERARPGRSTCHIDVRERSRPQLVWRAWVSYGLVRRRVRRFLDVVCTAPQASPCVFLSDSTRAGLVSAVGRHDICAR
ncbi:hypothetical protein BD310DRAFT_914373 [Dichomitus squalens]|uniref:Uncharacterized protein n=1 Tax=Dichomitus squalens TaxID=114155 RepID=A0A4Q9QAJ5_9APHY|nr:hypothetical protein BD310DRAFT_914373 [Dichomitus squalens]